MFNEANSLPALIDFTAQRGDEWQQDIYLLHNIYSATSPFDFPALPENAKINLNNCYAKLEIRKGGKYVRRITNNGIGGIITENGRIDLRLTAAQTQALKPDKYQYELRLTLENGQVITYIKGFFRIVIDEDLTPDAVLIVGNLESAIFLKGDAQAKFTKPPTPENSAPQPIQGLQQARLFFKAANGDYYIQYIDNQGFIRHRKDDPQRYSNAIIFLPPL